MQIRLETLKTLYDLMHSLVKESDDQERESGRVYSPNDRDRAQQLRDALIPAISNAKSEYAYEILGELRSKATAETAKYLRHVQFRLREEQAMQSPIAQMDYPEFERKLAPKVSGYTAFAMAVERGL
jgi:hypothetical protein